MEAFQLRSVNIHTQDLLFGRMPSAGPRPRLNERYIGSAEKHYAVQWNINLVRDSIDSRHQVGWVATKGKECI